MIIQQKTHKKMIFGITGAVVALVFLASAIYVYAFDGNLFGWAKDKTTEDADTSKVTEEQRDNAQKIKHESLSNDSDGAGSDDKKPTANTPAAKNDPGITITAVGQNGAMFQLRTLIDTVTTGTCTLSLEKGAVLVTKTADLQPTAESSTCKGFDVPTSELSPGDWKATVSFENNTYKGSDSKTITIK